MGVCLQALRCGGQLHGGERRHLRRLRRRLRRRRRRPEAGGPARALAYLWSEAGGSARAFGGVVPVAVCRDGFGVRGGGRRVPHLLDRAHPFVGGDRRQLPMPALVHRRHAQHVDDAAHPIGVHAALAGHPRAQVRIRVLHARRAAAAGVAADMGVGPVGVGARERRRPADRHVLLPEQRALRLLLLQLDGAVRRRRHAAGRLRRWVPAVPS